MEGHVLLKKLRDALELLRGRLTGKNKEDVEKAISMVSCSYLLCISFKMVEMESECYIYMVQLFLNWIEGTIVRRLTMQTAEI